MSPAVSGRPTAGVAVAVTMAAAAGLGTHTLGPVDAMHQVLSDAAVTPSGATALGTACAALVVAAGLLAAAARRTRWCGPVRALLALWAVGLIALAVFPTNLPGTTVTTSAVIHRYGAAIAVAVPPLVALLVARTPRLRTVALGTGAMAAGYGLAHIPTILTGVAALPFTGLWERLLLGLVLLLVLLTSAELRQPEVSGSPGREMSLVPAGRDDEAGGRGDAGEQCADGVAEVTPEAIDADGAGAPGGVRDVAEDGEQGRVDQCGTGTMRTAATAHGGEGRRGGDQADAGRLQEQAGDDQPLAAPVVGEPAGDHLAEAPDRQIPYKTLTNHSSEVSCPHVQIPRSSIGSLFQAFNLVATLTAEENICLPLTLSGRRPGVAVLDQVVSMLRLGDRMHHRPTELSGGQQQRVAVARALVARAQVVFADEPTGNLDTRAGQDILGFLRSAVDKHHQSIVVVTHDPNAAAWADHVVFVVDGRVHDVMDHPSADSMIDVMKGLGR